MSSSPDYIVEIRGLEGSGGGAEAAPGSHDASSASGPSAQRAGLRGRPWIAVRWKCCGVYSRVYRNVEATAYEGRCPSCGRPVRATVGAGGTSARFFEAG